MLAVKANRQYTITEADVDGFAKDGYDIYDEGGNIVKYGAGKTVSYDKYAELVKDYEKLMAENARLNDEVVKLTEKLAKAKAPRGRKKADAEPGKAEE